MSVGDVLTATLTVANQAEVPAEELTLTLALPPDAAPADPGERGLDAAGWRWLLGTLPSQGETVVTATLRLTAIPAGEALVLEPEVSARGLELPIVAVGGALVSTDPSSTEPALASDGASTESAEPAGGIAAVPASSMVPSEMPTAVPTDEARAASPTDEAPMASYPGEATNPSSTELDASTSGMTLRSEDLPQATSEVPVSPSVLAARQPAETVQARFLPGRPSLLRSRDGLVTVAFPATAFDRPLTLEHRTLPEQRPLLRARGRPEPPAHAAHRRGFGAFFLEAVDDQGRDIHHFTAPLTITIRFTPAQLRVLNLTPEALSIYWFDEEALSDAGPGRSQRGQWVPLATQVDAEAGTATATVDHFTGFQLGDGTSASAAFIPSLQGWQVSGFTGAASMSYPIDVPSGPNGIRPELHLSYSSAATDGVSGMRQTSQASWVGKGWSLDTGSVSLNKIDVSSGTQVNHYALTFNGRAFDLVRGAPLTSSPDAANPTHWEWHPTDESFIRVRAVSNGPSTPGGPGAPGRGAYDYSSTYTRYKWLVWDTSGTLFTFAEDIWWGWANCTSSGAFAYFESNRWLLSSITDTANNTVLYSYARSNSFYSSCMGQSGTVDFDVWPTTITWAGNRYKVEFVSSARTNDTQYDFPAYTLGGPARETRRLDAIKIWSNQASAWQLVRQYNFSYDYSLYSDERLCLNEPGCTTWGPNSGYRKLTLKSFQRVGAYDGSPPSLPALPATTFSYTTDGGSAFDAAGGWNRLTAVNNGQGGVLTLGYQNIAAAVAGSDHFRNRHRLSSKSATDGQGQSYTWNYAYGTPLANSIGTVLGDPVAGSATPTSAPLYYNVFLDGDADYSDERWLVHRTWTEFRGHSTMTETDPTGAKVKHSYYQGNPGCQPASGAKGSHAAISSDTCFQHMLLQDFVKGREYLTEIQTSTGSTLHATADEFALGPVDYTWAPLAGLWRAFSYVSATEDRALEGGATASTRRTTYEYDLTTNTNLTGQQYGNRSLEKTYSNGTLQRITMYFYTGVVTPSEYLVDRVRAIVSWDSSWRTLAFTARFYDGSQADGGIGSCAGTSTCGLLTRESALYDIPLQNNLAGLTLHSRDTTYTYDPYGNQESVTTYLGAGTAVLSGSTWSYSAPGGGSNGQTSTTTYDSVYHALPVRRTNAAGHVERAEYDLRMGALTQLDGPNGPNGGDSALACSALFSSGSSTAIADDVSCAAYDLHGRLVKLVRPGDSAAYPTLSATYADSAVPFRYDYSQRVLAGTATVRRTRVYFDGLGRLIETKVESKATAPYQSIASFTRYDGLGQIIAQSQPTYVTEADAAAFYAYTPPAAVGGVRWTTTGYDALGRLRTVTDPANAVTTHSYAVVSGLREHAVVDANQHRTRQHTDSLGRLVRVVADNGTGPWSASAATTYAYTPLDLLDSVTDAKGNLTSLDYDSLGRKR